MKLEFLIDGLELKVTTEDLTVDLTAVGLLAVGLTVGLTAVGFIDGSRDELDEGFDVMAEEVCNPFAK